MKNNIKGNGLAREGGLGQNKHWKKNMTPVLWDACFAVPASIYSYAQSILFSRVYFSYFRT